MLREKLLVHLEIYNLRYTCLRCMLRKNFFEFFLFIFGIKPFYIAKAYGFNLVLIWYTFLVIDFGD